MRLTSSSEYFWKNGFPSFPPSNSIYLKFYQKDIFSDNKVAKYFQIKYFHRKLGGNNVKSIFQKKYFVKKQAGNVLKQTELQLKYFIFRLSVEN